MKLNAELYKGDIKVCSFLLTLDLVDIYAENIAVHNKDLCPENITEWLRDRASDITKDDTDEDIMDFYKCVSRFTLGRMKPFAPAKAVLSYMRSNDDYALYPQKREFIYFGNIDERFSGLFVFLPFRDIGLVELPVDIWQSGSWIPRTCTKSKDVVKESL